jgi:hypothetical protein
VITFVLSAVFLVACATAALAANAWLAGQRYDQWVRDFEENGGIQWPCSVLDGSDVVSHTIMVERRCRAR